MSPSPQNNASSGRLRRVLVWLLGIAAGISALFAGLNFLFGPGLIPTIYHHFSTPSVKLEGWPKEIRLNEQATFTVLVDSKDATGHYRCSWTVDGLPTPPDIGGGVRQDDCQPFRVQNLGTNFRPDQDRQTINIGGDVWDSTGRQRLNGAVDNVTLVNAADPEIRVTPGAIPLNGTATFNVTLGGDVVPTAYRCLWSVTGLQQQPHADGSNNDCKDFKFHAPADMADPEQGRLLVELRLLDAAKKVVGTKTAYITVKRPLSAFFLYELDTTERMERPNGPGLPDAIADIQNSIRQNSLVLAQVGIKTFGKAAPHSNPGDCGIVEIIYPLQPVDVEAAAKSLKGIRINGTNAPVVAAVVAAIDDFKGLLATPNARFELVIVTAGSDMCSGGKTTQDLDRIQAVIRSSNAGGFLVDFKLLALTLQLVPTQKAAQDVMKEAEQILSKGQDAPGANLLLPITASDLNNALSAAAALLQPDEKARATACDRLKQMFYKVNGERAAERLGAFCANVG